MNRPIDLERLSAALLGTGLVMLEAPHTFTIIRDVIGTRGIGPPPPASDFVKTQPLPLGWFAART